jgi:hypothetical protein
MGYYYDIPDQGRSSSTGMRMIAVLVILMLILAGGMALLLRFGGDNGVIVPDSERIRVAVLDSGIDIDSTLEGRVVAEKSFVLPQYGYTSTDLSVNDSRPDGYPHGTTVAKAVVDSSANTVIVNGRVLGQEGLATPAGLIAAIYWAVEQNCSVINLSLGSSPTFGDPLQAAVEWAFDQGVVVVAAAGNEDDRNLTGTSITSPSVFSKCLAVGGLGTTGQPLGFTSHGPAAAGYMKPDICAAGYYNTVDGQYQGTSFASPRVAAAAADLIAYSQLNNITYTPGSIMTALLLGATDLLYPEYIVGAGRVNVQNSIQILDSNSEQFELPELVYAHPASLPLDYEVLFYEDTYRFDLQIFTSGVTTFDVVINAENTSMYEIADEVTINQTGFVPLTINVPSSISPAVVFDATIDFHSALSMNASIDIEFTSEAALARIAFDTSLTPWSIDTHYGQFRDYYRTLTENGISVTEIRNESEISLNYLEEFDGVVLLDPFTWDLNETDPLNANFFSLPYDPSTKQAYQDYYLGGGGIFVSALSNLTLNINRLNDFINWTGFSFGMQRIPLGDSPTLITNINPAHPITDGVGSFDYIGARLFIPGSAIELGRTGSSIVLGCLQGAGGGRLVVTGTNYFIDNWGINGDYGSSYNALLGLQIAQWITDLL